MQLSVLPAFAITDSPEFMTPRDLLSANSVSNINLRNSRSSAVTVYGLYVRQFSYVASGSTSCSGATPMYSSSQNTTAGSFVTPTVINAGKSAALGSNYLYNMLFQAIYYISINFPNAACELPGCTWGSDPTIYNWCIFLGALAPVVTTAGYTANVPPSADVASSGASYDYNLISSYVSLGPIACNDQTLTCTVATQQTQSF